MNLTYTYQPGDEVKITLKNGWWCIGKVITAANWGTNEEPNWYIEIDKQTIRNPINNDARGKKGLGYGYWKQKIDGGFIELVKRYE